MKNLLYIGNQLSKHGLTPTTIETLGPLLERHYKLSYASSKKNKVWRLLDMILIFLQHQRKTDYMILDTYGSLNFYYTFILSQLARLFKIPYMPILHGGNLPMRLKKNKTLCKLIFKHSYQNIAPSGYMQAAFSAHGYKTIIIPNFISIQDYTFQQRETFRPKLLWVRSFEQTYHPQMAIRVLKKLSQTYPTAELCMVGPDKDGSLKACQQLAVELNISDKVLFTGKLTKQEWHQLSTQYDVFINTTNADNTPVSVMEAMALGLPVVSTDVGGLPYLLQHKKTGLLVTKGDWEAMAQAIIEIIGKIDTGKSIASEARIKAETFDKEIILSQWQKILE